ncbi:MAG: cytochrome c biogenesis protein CcdA [bacterium]|nr:cytochrome c biogenesis protein CcdA [bacterium]
MRILPPFLRWISSVTLLCLIILPVSAKAGLGDSPFGAESIADQDLVQASVHMEAESVRPGMSYPARLKVEISEGWHINSAAPLEDWLIAAELSSPTDGPIAIHSVQYPKGENTILLESEFSVYSEQFSIPFTVTIADDAPIGETALPVSFTYQPCNDRECRAPNSLELTLPIQVSTDGEIGQTVSDDMSADGSESNSVSEPNKLDQLITEYGFWGYFMALGLAFLTGLLLSFSPCTYPMVPITVSIFAGSDRGMGRGFVLSLFFVGSMAVVYGIMGLIVSLVGGVFGAWLASPGVVIGIAIVFVIFSLSMFGLFELNVPSALRQKLGTSGSSGGVAGSILMGAIAALVVSPCVGPFVAGILLYVATSGSPVLGFLILFVFAMGLGTLYILIGTFSSAINQLPGAGGWMETVKKFFGFVLLIMAIYFLRTIIPVWITALLTSLLLLALGVFGGGLDRLTSESTGFARLKKFVGLIATILGIYLFVGLLFSEGFIFAPASNWLPAISGERKEAGGELISWEHSLETGLERAAKENKPVLIDTWATWCANCKVLDKKTFGNADVAAEAQRFVAIKAQLEKAGSPEVKAFMERFGLKHYSLPTTLLLDSSGEVRRVMQGVIEPDEMIAEMQKVR